MAIKINAREQYLKVGKTPGYYYVMTPELYIALTEKKIIEEASTHSGISRGVLKAAWDAAGDVIRAWATEGHSVAIPGLGTMRFTVRSKAVADVNKVKANLIESRRIVFTPSVDLKDELARTAIQITCYDRNGNIVKRVTSGDEGEVEDNENENQNQNENQGGSGSSENQGGNSGNSGNSGSQTPSVPTLTISRSGSGSSAVTVGGNAVNSGSQIAAGTEVALSVTPAEGQTPTATLNGSSVTLTESDGTYTGTFQMPDGNATLVINSGSTGGGGGVDQN